MSCTATTRAGKRCRRPASAGSELCHAHAGAQVGRPEKLSDEVRRRLVEAVRAGNATEVAAAYAGISRSTFHRWLARPEARFCALKEELRRAEAEAEVHAVATLRRAMPDDWRAAEAYLTMCHPERWARRGARAGLPNHQEQGEVRTSAIIADRRGRELIRELRARMGGARAPQPGEPRASD